MKACKVVAGLFFEFVVGSACASPIDLSNALPNFFGAGIGSTTEYAGGKDRIVGVLPGMRYVTNGGQLFEWYGTYAQYNFGGLSGFQWGPALALRLGRRNVDDPVVSQIHNVPTTLEGGGFVGYEYSHVSDVPYRLRGEVTVVTNAGSVYTGARVSLNTSAWFPLHARVFVGGGAGATWVSGGFNETYYGVTPEDAQKSGLPVFNPGSGFNQITGWIAGIYQLSTSWYAGAMVYYQRLVGESGLEPDRDTARYTQSVDLRRGTCLCLSMNQGVPTILNSPMSSHTVSRAAFESSVLFLAQYSWTIRPALTRYG